MTLIRGTEIVGASLVATATAAAAVAETGVPAWVGWLLTIGAGVVAGYFSARITTEKALTRLETRHDATDAAIASVRKAMDDQSKAIDHAVAGVREELRWYYQRRGPEA